MGMIVKEDTLQAHFLEALRILYRAPEVIGSPPCGIRPVSTQGATFPGQLTAAKARCVSSVTTCSKNARGNPRSILAKEFTSGKSTPNQAFTAVKQSCSVRLGFHA